MPHITCTRLIAFDTAHRVMLHEGKCKYVHGHRYTAQVSFRAEGAGELDSLGRVVDFGVIKDILGQWIDTHWDHTCVLWDKDKALGEAIAAETGQTIYYIPYNPTAENMALYLLKTICPKLFNGHEVTCTSVTIHETPNCAAAAAL